MSRPNKDHELKGAILKLNETYLLDDLAAMLIQLSTKGTAGSDNWFLRLSGLAASAVTTCLSFGH